MKQTEIMKEYGVLHRALLTYGRISRVLSGRDRSKFSAMEMKYLRRVEAVFRRDRIRNYLIRDGLSL